MKHRIFYFGMLFLLGSACQVHDPADGHNHAAPQDVHVHEAKEYTIYSDHLELFIEMEELAFGEESVMMAHLTTIGENYGPLISASVSLQVKMGREIFHKMKARSEYPGIYTVNIKPTREGVFDLYFLIESTNFKDTLIIPHVHVSGHDGGSHQHEHSEVPLGEIIYTKEQVWESDFRVDKIKKVPFSDIVAAGGEMTAMPGEKQNITARTEGLLLFTTHDLVQGSVVQSGELLFTISGKGMADNNVAVKFHDAKTNYLLSQSDFERQSKLYDQRVVSHRQYLESKSRYETDSVLYYSLAETVSTGGMNIYAPKTGYLHELNVSEGQFVNKGQLLATLSTDEFILLRADVPQHHYEDLKKVYNTTFRPAYSDRVYTLEELNGKLLAKGSSVAENDHYLPLYFEVTNDGSLIEGALVEFYLKTRPGANELVVPVSALIEEQGNFYVFVQVSGETYSKRQVKVKADDGISAAISDGLEPGERIVTKGVMLVKTASINSIPSHGHAH